MFNTPEGNKILRYGSIALIALAVFLAVQIIYTLVLTAYVGESSSPLNLITVNGFGEKLVVPDVATFSFGVQMTGETVASAQKIVTERVNKAVEIVKTAGVNEKDIKTVGYNIYPRYEYVSVSICNQFGCPPSEQKLIGYEVSQTIEVKVRDISKAGEILGNLGSVEITNVSGINFTLDKPDELKAETRSKAIADAKTKANKLAKDLGVKLGRVVNFNEGDYPMPIYQLEAYGKGGDMSGVPTPVPEVPPGENTIVSNVSITYEIK